MRIEEFNNAFSDWLEKNQDFLLKSDWQQVAKSYPFVEGGVDNLKYTEFKRKLKFCRVSLITGGGLYLREKQEPFNVTAFEGDFSWRVIPRQIFADDIESCHEYTSFHYARRDMNVVFPLERFRRLEEEEVIGELSETNYSIYDFAPNAGKVTTELGGPLAEKLVEDEIDVALFFPVCELGHQTMSLIQNEVEKRGVATVSIGTNSAAFQRIGSPRYVVSDFPEGAPMGEPNNERMQRNLLGEVIDFLSSNKEKGGKLTTTLSWHDPFV